MSVSPPHYSSLNINDDVPEPSLPHRQERVRASNESAYTLATIAHAGPSTPRSCSPASMLSGDSDRTPLLNLSSTRSDPRRQTDYGTSTMPMSPNPSVSSRKVLLNAGMKMAALFIVSTLILGGTLWLALPPLEEADRPMLRIPKSFAQLKELNYLLKKYRDFYPVRVVICYVTTYLFLQAFSLPGSMYLSILGGAVWGVPVALPLACTCVATGATLCYLISAALGPAILTLPKWAARLDSWSEKIAAQRANLLSYLIILRIAPFPPHWVVNVLAPHLRIGIIPFWVSTFLGILGVSVIHTTIGGGLDDMTSADDFHLISWRNALGLSAVVVGVLIPVGLRYALSKRVGPIALSEDEDTEAGEPNVLLGANGDAVLAQGPYMSGNGKSKSGLVPSGSTSSSQQPPLLVLLSDSEDEEEDDSEDLLEEEEDEILMAGPALVPIPAKGKGLAALGSVPSPLSGSSLASESSSSRGTGSST